MKGITTERFWRLTPAEIGIEIEAWDKQEEMLDYRAALICATIANAIPTRRKKTFTPGDFMPQRKAERQDRARPWSDIKENLQAMVRNYNSAARR